ncbi:MAG: TraR/DksA family transcriptional regulator [Planctomycetia bacterium]
MMKQADLELYRKRLMTLRARLTGELQHLNEEAFRENNEQSTQPNHPAELGSKQYEQEVTIQMLQCEENVLGEINAAIDRIKEGTYGVCEASGKPIPKARLNVIPWTRYRVEFAD